ncbi:MAG: ATP-binding cassette domain-containing protein [Planctomycetes bacterium]|nr:ATP-binding cassette domain-containing protein [Planctomycetota bacterium]
MPEVIQTSAMDCGPAVLKCLLEGFGIPVNYGRLREACQTDVDGTSIDTLEDVARRLGLDAEQIMLPVDHLLLPEAKALPALLVTRQPNGFTHFVLVWRRHGPFVQVMDPGVGRRWLTGKRLLEEVYVHGQRVPAAAWREWARSEGFRGPLARRLRRLGLGRSARSLLEASAMALLDAATRLVETLVRAGGLRCGREAENVLHTLLERARAEGPAPGQVIPERYWSVVPAARGPEGAQVLFRGAVLVRVRGRYQPEAQAKAPDEDRRGEPGGSPGGAEQLGPELAAAVAEPAVRPSRLLSRLLRGAGALSFLALAAGLLLAACGTVLEGVLLRSLIDLGRELRLAEQRLLALGCFLGLAAALLLIDWRVARGLLRLGRQLEARLRMSFLEKIPRLNDRYFQSRPTSDMAERSHALQMVRLLPRLAGQFLRATLTLGITAAAIAWIDPPSALPAFLAAAVAIALPLALNPFLAGLDLRVRTHAGALGRFYLDALLGLSAIRAHGAERAVRREHEGLLVEWARASLRLLRWVVIVEGLQAAVGFGLAGWLLLLHAGRAADTGGMLLLAYWALSLPVLGEEIALLARQYPSQRNIMLRLLEPLGAPEAASGGCEPPGSVPGGSPPPLAKRRGVAVTFDAVTVRAAGHTILDGLNVHVAAGSHVAIVGASGAGKSSLVGLLLGWHRAAAGRVLIDGELLDATRLDRLRAETAWVDPAVQLWNRSLLQNLLYGTHDAATPPGEVLYQADLYGVVQRLPDGLQTSLGEGGGLLSGGEGQRVRLGRALTRSRARLVILDEPFRGLDRAQRRELLRRARQHWREATLLCITHDVGETRDFERVLVIEGGRVVEDGSPALLAEEPGSRYRELLDAEEAVRTGLWSSPVLRRLRLAEGDLVDETTGDRV